MEASAAAAAAVDRLAAGLSSVVETQGESVQQAVDGELTLRVGQFGV